MFREVRRKDRALKKEDAIEILKKAEYGLISTIGEDGYPYGIPVNHIYMDGKIYFHCGKEGHKVDNFKYCDKVSFCTVTHFIVNSKDTSGTYEYESALVFGKVKEITDEELHGRILDNIFLRFYPNNKEELIKARQAYKTTRVYGIEIEHITGKAEG